MKNKESCRKILKYTGKLLEYTKGVKHDDFMTNDILVEACVFDILQIGELVKVIDRKFKEKHTEIPWHQIYGLRNRIVHDYGGINREYVWEVVSKDIPKLEKSLNRILDSEKDIERDFGTRKES